MFNSNIRVAAIVYRVNNGVPLIALHVPMKSDMLNDFSYTTITEKLRRRESASSIITWAVMDCLGLPIQAVEAPHELALATQYAKGKEYRWFLVRIDERFPVIQNPKRIQLLTWCCPQEIGPLLPQMSDTRREMFSAALKEAITVVPALESFTDHIDLHASPQMQVLA